MTLVLAKEFTANLESPLSVTDVEHNLQGTSWGAVNSDHDVLFAWIGTISGSKKVIGRIDGRGHTDDSKVATKELSTTTAVDGVRCAYNPNTDGWVVVFNVGTSLYYRLFDSTLTATSSDTSLATMTSGSDAATYNLGCDEDGFFTVSWPGQAIRVDSDDESVVQNKSLNNGEGYRMHVHVESGNIDFTRIDQGDDSIIIIDRYDRNLCYRYSLTAIDAANSHVDELHDITSHYGTDSIFLAYIENTGSGDNVKYRAFGTDGQPLYATQTVSGTGNVDISSSQGRLHLTVGERPLINEPCHTFIIRATSTNASSNRAVILVEPERYNPQTIELVEVASISDSDARYGQPVVATNQFEIRMLKPTAALTAMELEVYVRQSVWMSLWRIETTARVFVDNGVDPDAKTLVEAEYTTYPSGSKLAGSAGTDDTDYTGAPGRGAVNPDTTAFSSYWGTATTEDNVFLGGPVLSEIADSFENNANHFDSQITTLSSEIGIAGIEWIIAGRNQGWDFGTNTPEIQTSVGGTTHDLQRHVLGSGVWQQANTPSQTYAVDYGYIIRLPLTSTSTQADRAHIYISGINKHGTEAASFVYSNAVSYCLGASLAHLIVIEYDDAIQDGAYDPATDGVLRVVPMKDIDADNFEGMR